MQAGKAYEVLICKAYRETRYISTKCSIWIDPLYFEWEKFIPTLEKHFPDILYEIWSHDNQRSASANREFTTSLRCSHTNIEKHKDHPALDFCNQEIEGMASIPAASAIAHQRYFKIIITTLQSQTLLVMKTTPWGIHPSPLQMNQRITTA